MHVLPLALIVATDATPMPTMTVNPDDVTPGFVGFVAIAVVAIALVLLIIDMLRRIRRAGYRAEISADLDAEEQAAAEAQAAAQATSAEQATETDDEDIDPQR